MTSFASLYSSSAVSVSSTSLGSSSTSRMRPSAAMVAPPPVRSSLRLGQRNIERRAVIHRAFGADRSAVTLNDTLNRREANSGALELLGEMQALKHAEQLVLVLHIEAGAIIPDEYLDVAVVPADAAD